MKFPTPPSFAPSAINHLLADESWARDKLIAHSGKIARFDAGLFALELQVLADGLVAQAAEGSTPAVTVKVKTGDTCR